MPVLRSCRPAAVERPGLIRPSGIQDSRAPWRIVLRSSGVLLMPGGETQWDETTVLILRMACNASTTRHGASALKPSAPRAAEHIRPQVTCDAARWQESRCLSFPVVNDSRNAAIGSGEPKASPSVLRSRWRANRADQASTMTLGSPQTWIGPRSERKHRPDRVFRQTEGDQCGWWQATRSGVENETAGCDREISCNSNPGRNMRFQIYGSRPIRLLKFSC
jgi:hypothetical protein